MNVALQTQGGRYINALADRMGTFFDHTRTLPFISIVPGIAETAIDTTCGVVALASGILCHTMRFSPYPRSLRNRIRPYAGDSISLTKKFFKNAAVGLVSTVPVIGTTVAGQVLQLRESAKTQHEMAQMLSGQVTQLTDEVRKAKEVPTVFGSSKCGELHQETTTITSRLQKVLDGAKGSSQRTKELEHSLAIKTEFSEKQALQIAQLTQKSEQDKEKLQRQQDEIQQLKKSEETSKAFIERMRNDQAKVLKEKEALTASVADMKEQIRKLRSENELNLSVRSALTQERDGLAEAVKGHIAQQEVDRSKIDELQKKLDESETNSTQRETELLRLEKELRKVGDLEAQLAAIQGILPTEGVVLQS